MSGEATRRHVAPIEALRTAVLEGSGAVPAETREAAARGDDVPAPYAEYVDAIHRHAYRITDRSIAELRMSGASDEEIFEVTVAAAFGAAFERFDAGMRALRAAGGAEPEEPG
jgi:hypothetical protein